MNDHLKRLLFEAFRRNDMADSVERAKPILTRWLGLGTAAAYRPAIEEGLMVFWDGRTPPPRCDGWLCLTCKGLAVLQEHEVEFAEMLRKLKETRYAKSYEARFMLAGALTAGDGT